MRMRGGGMSSLMPASINDFNHGNFATGQTSTGGSSIDTHTNVSLAQSGGSRRKGKGKRRRMRGGLAPLNPELLGGDVPTTSQKGGYFSSVLKAALVPFGLMGLNQYAHDHSGKTAYRGKSRLSKKLQSRRHNR
jgi:hypothetical protein